jgi:hypothetical protein
VKVFTAIATAATLSLAGTAALASGPVPMTDEQLDNVTAGLVTVVVFDVVDINDITLQVAIPVNANINAAAQVGILSRQAMDQDVAQGITRPGRIIQR